MGPVDAQNESGGSMALLGDDRQGRQQKEKTHPSR